MQFSLIGIAIVALFGVLAGLVYESADGVLFGLSWAYAGYKLMKAIWIIWWKLPKQRSHLIPKGLDIPRHITRGNLPSWRDNSQASTDIRDLVNDIIEKIGNAADESAVRGFVQDRLATMRDKIESRYSHARREIDVIAYEGMIGTLLSLVTFMVQGKVLFQIPASGDSAELIAKMSQNLSSIDLVTVASGFVASIFGWMVKTYVGGVLEFRKDLEHEDLTEVEEWLQRQIFARLRLENITTIVLPTLQEAAAELEESLRAVSLVMEKSETMIEANNLVTEGLKTITAAVLAVLTDPEGLRVKAEHVAGGILYSVPKEGGHNDKKV